MRILNKEVELDRQLFEDILYNYKNNINAFKEQNSGFVIENVKELTEFDVLKFILLNVEVENNTTIDKNFIREHFRGFAINPIVEELDTGYTNKVHLIPDIVCEAIK